MHSEPDKVPSFVVLFIENICCFLCFVSQTCQEGGNLRLKHEQVAPLVFKTFPEFQTLSIKKQDCLTEKSR